MNGFFVDQLKSNSLPNQGTPARLPANVVKLGLFLYITN